MTMHGKRNQSARRLKRNARIPQTSSAISLIPDPFNGPKKQYRRNDLFT